MLHVHSFFVSAFCALLLVANYSGDAYEPIALTRRRALLSTLAPSIVALAGCDVLVVPAPANGVTQIPEFKYQKSYLASVLLNTFDQATHESTVDFFTNAFIGCELRREEKDKDGSVTTVLGFGNDKQSIPEDFSPGVSAYKYYGGHPNLTLRYSPSASPPPRPTPETLTTVAYLELAVPGYRISKIMSTGGTMLSAYGYANCVAPNGLHVRAIVADPVGQSIVYLALRCKEGVSVSEVVSYYKNQHGMVETLLPKTRPEGQDEFEPRTFPGATYLAVGGGRADTMGVLVLPSDYVADGEDEVFIGRKETIKQKILGGAPVKGEVGRVVDDTALGGLTFVCEEGELQGREALGRDPLGNRVFSVAEAPKI